MSGIYHNQIRRIVMTEHVIAKMREFVNACEFESTQEAVESGMGIVGGEIMIMFHPLYEEYVLSKNFLVKLDGAGVMV
jgi:hypothetical protein